MKFKKNWEKDEILKELLIKQIDILTQTHLTIKIIDHQQEVLEQIAGKVGLDRQKIRDKFNEATQLSREYRIELLEDWGLDVDDLE